MAPLWESRFPKMFACGNLESGIQEILIVESGIPLTIRIQNQVLLTNTGIKCLESEIHAVELRIQHCLGFSSTQGAKKVIFKACHSGKLKLQPRTKLLRQFHLFSNFCALLPSPLNRKSKPPPHPLFKVVLV